MNGFTNFLETFSIIITILLLISCVLMASAISHTNRRLNRMKKRYDLMLRGTNDIDLEEYLKLIGQTLVSQEKSIKSLEKNYKNHIIQLEEAKTKSAFLHYSVFTDDLGDRSWSYALLDRNLNGLIISSIFGREGSTTFAKSIVNGKPESKLSDEEYKVLRMAIDGKNEK